jgi:hypothetical protein
MLTQVEMECMLGFDYDCVATATKEQSDELRKQILKYDDDTKRELKTKGSDFIKHRENIIK